jgi:hypothetical protein
VIDGLLANLPQDYVVTLPTDALPLSRFKRTLADLNRTERLVDGTVPLSVWLSDAVSYAGGKPALLDAINRALADVSRRATGAALAPAAGVQDRNERIVGTNDLLPFDFLRRGDEAGRAVARICVPRYEGGRPVISNGAPVRYLGTCWLLAPDLVITNHHVVNARREGEPDAPAADLALQVQAAEVQFDYDGALGASSLHKVARIESFAPRGGPLDYAVLRLAHAVDRKPLSVRGTPLTLPASREPCPSVNILQHPEGRPKMIACRNNLVTRVEGAQVWYFTDTLSGSSGSPVLDDGWVVVALHKCWDYLRGVTYQGRETAWANQGTQMFAILDHLRQSAREDIVSKISLG